MTPDERGGAADDSGSSHLRVRSWFLPQTGESPNKNRGAFYPITLDSDQSMINFHRFALCLPRSSSVALPYLAQSKLSPVEKSEVSTTDVVFNQLRWRNGLAIHGPKVPAVGTRFLLEQIDPGLAGERGVLNNNDPVPAGCAREADGRPIAESLAGSWLRSWARGSAKAAMPLSP
jgi:hypothetical protein